MRSGSILGVLISVEKRHSERAPHVPTPVTVEYLQSLNPEVFTRLVRDTAAPYPRDSDGGSAEERAALWELLTSPALIHRVISELKNALRDIDDQLAASRAELDAFQQACFAEGGTGKSRWFKAKSDNDEWRARTLRKKAIVDRRLRMVKAVLESSAPKRHPAPPNPARNKRNLDSLFRLAYAVSMHQKSFEESDFLPEDHDLELWDALDKVTVAVADGEMKLSDWVEDIASKPGFTPREEM